MAEHEKLFKIKRDTHKFKQGAVVSYKHCTDSGSCYLVADLSDDLHREWIMTYDLEKIKTEEEEREEAIRRKTSELMLQLLLRGKY